MADACTRTQWPEALATLPLNLRQVLMLQLEGFDYQEIADMLGISAENQLEFARIAPAIVAGSPCSRRRASDEFSTIC